MKLNDCLKRRRSSRVKFSTREKWCKLRARTFTEHVSVVTVFLARALTIIFSRSVSVHCEWLPEVQVQSLSWQWKAEHLEIL